MSTEFERRIKALEKKIGPSVPCRHPLSVLINPSDEDIDAMLQELAACPNCRTPKIGSPSMLIVRLAKTAVVPMLNAGTAQHALSDHDFRVAGDDSENGVDDWLKITH
jgi:hypothetical protein